MRNWRQLERHPLSAEYKNLRAKINKELVECIRQYGYLHERPITLHEGKVLEGWQRLQACVEADVEPTFVELPEGWPLDKYVSAVNDIRRHEPPDVIEKRRKRIAEKRAAGMSTRQIAEEEDVSQSTVQREVADMEVEKVKGKDGKNHSAKKSGESCDSVGSMKLCKRCQVAGKVKDCADCKAPKKRKSGRPTYSWKNFNSGVGTVVRELSAVCKLHGHPLNSPKVNEFKERMEKYAKDFRNFYAELVALPPKG